ncbi:MAG: hypothetical protein J3R72DRAFT_70805 [Linnemannia gamsii]|nr:MAG: hypothetical protein J3R72DRAFT_70805 [Linnemannia gamsii]
MENNLAVQAKVALTNLYHWVLDHQPLHFQAKPSSSTSTVASVASQAVSLASSYVDSYLNPSNTHPHETHSLHLHYQPPHHTAGASSPSSGSCGTANDHQAGGGGGSFCYRNNPEDSPSSPHNFLTSFFQSFTHGCTSKLWDPITSFDSFLWNYTPDIHAFQEKLLQGLGAGGLVEKYNIDPRIVALLLMLPLVILLLITCVVMGAGNTSDQRPGPGHSGRKTDPTLVGGAGSKNEGRRGESKKQGSGPSGSSSSSSFGSGSNKGGKKRGGPSDVVASQYLLGNDSGISSWSAILGSMGFLGGEALDYKPLDILASLSEGPMTTTTTTTITTANPIHVDQDTPALGSVFESMSALGSEMMKHIPYQHLLDQDIAQLLGSDFLDSDTPGEEGESVDKSEKDVSEPLVSADHTKATYASASTHGSNAPPTASVRSAKVVPPTTATKSSSKNQEREPEHHIQHQQESTGGRQSGKGPAGPGDDSLKTRVPSVPGPPLRTRTPRQSGSFRESDRPKVHPTPNLTTAASVTVKPAAVVMQQPTGNIGRDMGSKIFGFVQESQLLKNMDSLSGGLLGSAVATVVALASSAEATAGVIKYNLPDSVTDFTDELRQSFDHAMRVQQDEEIDAANKQKSWGVRDAISKIMQDDDDHVVTTAATSSSSQAKLAPTTALASTVRVPLSSGTTTAPASSKPISKSAAPKDHPAEDISARPTGPVAPRVVDANEQSELSSDDNSDKFQSISRPSSGGATLSKELASAMASFQETSSSAAAATGGEGEVIVVAPSAHTEHEDEDYYLEDVQDSGDEADDDEKEEADDGDEDEDDEDDDEDGKDGAFVLAKDTMEGTQTSGSIASRTRLQEELDESETIVHPHDEAAENAGSVSSSGGSIADDELPPTLSTSTSSDTLSKIPVVHHVHQEMTVDDRGNKVPVSTEARRDSGFDLLL